MHLLRVCLILFLLFCASIVSASEELVPPGGLGTIDLLVERAIDRHLIAGGVVVIGNHDGILYSTAKGPLGPNPGAPPLTDRTVFDLASLTKVFATTPAIMKLLDEGKISLLDPVSKWIPEFAGNGSEEITILNLLTHTSGLNDFDVPSSNAMEGAIRKAVAERRKARPGTSFNYADINFILLGEVVHRVSGKTLDVFCHDEIYEPLGADSTMFLPPQVMSESIAPTLGFRGGVVQDMNSRRLGSVAGHAGLFSSGQDLARFARLLLSGGIIDGKRILSERVVTQMTAPYFYSNGSVVRGLGWDMESPFSAPKGSLFSEVSFGHTGYSGSSIWIDPQRDLFVVLLTNRLNYRDVHSFNQLRRDISTIAAADFATTGDLQRLSQPLEAARITAELLRPSWSVVQPAPKKKVRVAHRAPIRKVKIAYASTESKSRQYEGKKRGKGRRLRYSGKSRRA